MLKFRAFPTSILAKRFNATTTSTSTTSVLASATTVTVTTNKRQINPANVSNFDLVVLGSGPAGQKAAVNAAKLKKKVAVIDTNLGGVCVHTGTIPSKTFREAVLFLTGYRQRGFYGKGYLQRHNISADDILERVHKVEGWEVDTIKDQLQRNRVTLIQGKGRFVDEHHVEIFDSVPADDMHAWSNNHASNSSNSPATSSSVTSNSAPANLENGSLLRAEKILIATGTRPAHNPLYDFNHPLIFDSDQILLKKHWSVPRDLIVVGSGVIAMEYASMFVTLPGARVTIIDEKPTFLDFVDREIIDTLRQSMRQNGATFRLGEKVVKVEPSSHGVTVQLESGKRVKGDALLYAVGRQGNTDSLSLESTNGVQANNRGLLKVNEHFQTSIPHIYAAGDCIGFPALASTAMEQGRLASQHMFCSQKSTVSPFFPYGIYTIPEISVIGKSEQQLTQEKIPYEIGICKFAETAKGAMLGYTGDAGFLKLLFDPESHKLLGAHCIGESAAEIIHIAQVVLSMGGTVEYFRDNVFNYPTFAEAYRIAALDALNRTQK